MVVMPKKSGLITEREADIGRRVQQVREHIKWPQPAFAEELDISRDRLASIEYGRTPLRYEIGYRLCVIFEINPRWLAEGAGEIKSTLLSPDLPKPEGFPSRSLFSRSYDEAVATKPARIGKKPASSAAGKAEKNQVFLANFDATSHVVRGLTDLLAKEKFRSPLERQEFALRITSYARELALSLRRERTRERTAPRTRKKEKGKRKKQN
jgi:transcriptional regulator with XRE-family HTH domain